MKSSEPSQSGADDGVVQRARRAVTALCRALLDSLPGQLLMVIVSLTAFGLVLVYFPAMAVHRLDWMEREVELAYRA